MKYERLIRNIEVTLGVIIVLLLISNFAVPFILSFLTTEFTIQGILAILIVIAILLLLMLFVEFNEIFYPAPERYGR